MNAEELFESNQHLVDRTILTLFNNVKGIAKQHRIETCDIYQMGFLGLWDACLKFDESKGKFKTMAINYIKWSITENLNRRTGIIKYNSKKIKSIQKFGILSMDNEMDDGSENETYTLHDLIPSDGDTQELAYGKINKKYIVDHLTNEEIDIINLKNKGLSFRKIGEQWGMTGENVRVKFNKIKNKIREMDEIEQWKIS